MTIARSNHTVVSRVTATWRCAEWLRSASEVDRYKYAGVDDADCLRAKVAERAYQMAAILEVRSFDPSQRPVGLLNSGDTFCVFCGQGDRIITSFEA